MNAAPSKPTRTPVLHDRKSQLDLAARVDAALAYRGECWLGGQDVGIRFAGSSETLWCVVDAHHQCENQLWPAHSAGSLVLARWILSDALDAECAMQFAPAFASEIVATFPNRAWSIDLDDVLAWYLAARERKGVAQW